MSLHRYISLYIDIYKSYFLYCCNYMLCFENLLTFSCALNPKGLAYDGYIFLMTTTFPCIGSCSFVYASHV